MSKTTSLITALLTLPVPAATDFPQAAESDQKPPSLVEMARRERARRDSIPGPVRLITNRDLTALSKDRVTTSRDATGWQRLPTRIEIDAEAEEATGPDRAFFEAAFAEARLAYQNEVSNNLVLQLRINNLRNAFATEDDGSRQGLIQAQLQESLALLSESETRISDARATISDLEKDAAEAGLLPHEIQELVGDLPTPSSLLPATNPNP